MISLQVAGLDTNTPRPNQNQEPVVVPNTVDLAQSFLQAQPSSERRKLEDEIAAESQDLGASVTSSDDDSEDDSSLGTGQGLSLPAFLANFLQGIVDRIQVKIKGVAFNLDVEVAIDPSSPSSEPVSFQIALDGVDVEGVTTQVEKEAGETEPSTILKEGKRLLSLHNLRAYLISEANVFSAFAQSPTTASPSLASSPALTRNPPSRETSGVSVHNLVESHVESTLQRSLDSLLADPESSDSEDELGDSEDALGIPYNFSEEEEGEGQGEDEERHQEVEGPATPRASVYHGFDDSPDRPQSVYHGFDDSVDPEESMFHSTVLPAQYLAQSAAFEAEAPQWASTYQESRSEPALRDLPSAAPPLGRPEVESPPPSWQEAPTYHTPGGDSVEDLTQSHLYTHEEAESMYMSAFSNASLADPRPVSRSSSPRSDTKEEPQTLSSSIAPQDRSEHLPTIDHKATMPGGWDETDESVTFSAPTLHVEETRNIAQSAVETSQIISHNEGSGTSTPTNMELETGPLHESIQEQPEHEPEGVATPRGPTRLKKEVFTMDRVSIYIPSNHQHVHVYPDTDEAFAGMSQTLDRSVYPQAPGAFSIHGAHTTSPPTNRELNEPETRQVDGDFEFDFSPMAINFDASLGFLLAKVVARLSEVIKPKQQATPDVETSDKDEEKKIPGIKARFQGLALNFINQLGGVADSTSRSMDPAAFILDHEVLLNATIQNLTIVSSTKASTVKARKGPPTKSLSTTTIIELETFRFGYETGDIISFDKTQPMSTSIRDPFLSSGRDIGVKMINANGETRTDVETLPLIIHMDLQRLDETFSWFGGLSSFLNMSSSMASHPANSIKPVIPQKPKPKGIRFDLPLDPERSAPSENKINLRIGGARVELQGKECSVVAEASTIKLVSRDGGIGTSIRSLRVAGPYIRSSRAEPAVTADMGGIRLDFITVPNDRDLERLLELIMPSKARFDKDNDGIMVDTLLRQRRKGSVLRVDVDKVNIRVRNLAQLEVLPVLGEEIAKLSTVTKYLPEDDRPGLLTLARLSEADFHINCGDRLGQFSASMEMLDAGHISVPSLVAVSARSIKAKRNEGEEIVSTSYSSEEAGERTPVIMLRLIGDEIEPVTKLKLHNLVVEYRVPFIMDILGLEEDATPQDFEAELAASVANLGDHAQHALRQSAGTTGKSKQGKPMTLEIGFENCLVGLNPLNLPSKMIVALTDAHLVVVLPKDVETKVDFQINKSSVLLIDDIEKASEGSSASSSRRKPSSFATRQVLDLYAQGFVNICYMSAMRVVVNVAPDTEGEKQVDVEVMNDLVILETCADSTQTLITLANALKPPTPESKGNKYRTGIVPMEDLLASISPEAFGNRDGEYDFDQDFAGAQELAGSRSEADFDGDNSLIINTQHYADDEEGEVLFNALQSSTSSHDHMQDTAEGVLLTGFDTSKGEISDSDEELVIHEDFYNKESNLHGTAKVWNFSKGTFDSAPVDLVERSPVKVNIKDVHVAWHLFDGYDWVKTRDAITKAVHDVEHKAMERYSNDEDQVEYYEEELEDDPIGDCLFNSIYIGIAPNRDPRDLARAINEDLNDNATETESIAPTAYTGASNRTVRPQQPKPKRLRLQRSKHHKITFELKGVNAHVITYPLDYEGITKSAIDVRIGDLDVFDHVPTSTWKKFATYDQDAGEREMGTSMAHLEIFNVKPTTHAAATEMVLRVNILPLRLHVDQDALDFITRFFEFKDDKVPVHASESDVPFIQRMEVFDVPIKLDFKPKRVDYTGIRSGRTTEFMNFIIMEEARMILKHVILHGVPGFDRMGKMLNDVWMAEVKSHQLPTVLAGLAPVRSLVNIGSGFKDLVEIPIREYKKDGRAFRSLSKGAAVFARNTGTELVKFGAKLAVGTQNVLQGAEEMLSDQTQAQGQWEEDEVDQEEKRQISVYADQPDTLRQGLRVGWQALARDFNMAGNALIAVHSEVLQSQTPGGATAAVLRRAPTIVFRPAMGVSKAVGQTLMGATNAIDPQQQRRINEVSPCHFPFTTLQSCLYIGNYCLTGLRLTYWCRNIRSIKPVNLLGLIITNFASEFPE